MDDFLSFKLPDSFIEDYANRQPDWAFPINVSKKSPLFLSELIYVDKYSALKEDGTKEQWYETCRRCIEGYYSILKDHCKQNRTPWNDFKALASAKDAFDRMFNFKWLPPGRGLQHMGRPIVHAEQNSAALQNCFDGSVQFITNEGVRTLAESVGEEVCVPVDGGWADGTVSSFGTQTVQSVTFRPFAVRSNIRNQITVTPNHRWILADGSETTKLKIGDVVKGNVAHNFKSGNDYYDGLLHGVIFGDGGKTSYRYVDGRYGYELRACDSRTEAIANHPELKSRWDTIYTDRPSGNGDSFYFIKSHEKFKEFPIGRNSDYCAGFLDGWIAADASIKPSGSYCLDSQHPDSTKWLEDHAALAGYSLVGFTINAGPTNFGARKNPLRRHTLLEGATEWKVVQIDDLDCETEVFCLTVPDTATFTLASGIYTGNCAFTSTEKLSNHSVQEATLPFVRMMEMSMWGIGVGFDTKGAGKLTLTEPLEDKTEVFVVPDNREGWAESVGKLIESYTFKSRPVVEFDYSEIRPAGTPLVRFGGRASGPEPLRTLHESLRSQLGKRGGEAITSRDIVDIMNKIGKAVVAGGARRSAQICFGDPDDTDYINIKNWNLPENSERTDAETGWAWNSNNSVFVEMGDDYSPMVQSIVESGGEPGFMWLGLAQEYGRLIDPPNFKDRRASGGNPCLEQTLEHMELCTLVETFPNKHSDYEDFRQTLKHAYLYGKAVTLMPTKWPESNEVMARNRRIGCSMSGLAEFVEQRGFSMLREWADEGYQFIVHRDEKYSEWLAVRESIKKTSIKPSGTVSLVAGATPGVHWPTASGWYIRRVRYSVHNPMVALLEKAGYEVEPAAGDPENTVVVTFITKGPNVRDERNVTVWEKAELATLMQRYWADNQVSATLTFLPEEEGQLLALLSSKDGQFKGVSFLPLGEQATYPQQPYEKLADNFDVESYLKQLKGVGNLYATGAEAIGDKFCDSDVCQL